MSLVIVFVLVPSSHGRPPAGPESAGAPFMPLEAGLNRVRKGREVQVTGGWDSPSTSTMSSARVAFRSA
jgi:hypothetical protein